MHPGRLSLLFWLTSCISVDRDAREDQKCTQDQDLDSATLLQTRVQSLFGDGIEMTDASDIDGVEEWKTRMEITDVEKAKLMCLPWDAKCIREKRRAKELAAKAKAKKEARAKKKCMAKFKDESSSTAGVRTNGSFNLDTMMAGMVTKAHQESQCLERNGANRKVIKKAKFKAKIFPKILKLLAPDIHGTLAKTDLRLLSLVHEGSQAVANLSAKGIEEINWLEYIIRSKVTSAVDYEVKHITRFVLNAVWDFVDPIESGILSALVAALGEIPFVGGFLAATASEGVSTVYNMVKKGVSNAVVNLFESIANGTINAILKEAFIPLDLVKNGIKNISDVVISDAGKLEAAGMAVANVLGNSTKAEYNKQADVARKNSAGMHESIISDAKSLA